MEVSATTPAGRPQNATAQSTEDVSDAALITSDFETFLTLLTAQLENQDPLNPIESQDFATQLATFSGVEQQVKTNELIGTLSAQMLTSSLGEMASWVGREARLTGTITFDDSPIRFLPNPPSFAERSELVVRNSEGTELQRLAVPVSNDPIDWAGVGADGERLPPGNYDFALESFRGDELISTQSPDALAEVTEVRNLNGQLMVVLKGGALHPASGVTGLS